MSAAFRSDSVDGVLIVEDDSVVRDVLREMLEEGGYAVQCVENGQAAYAALDSGRSYLALVVDVNLGEGVTGFDVARHARAAAPAVPVLYVSGQITAGAFGLHAVPGSLHLPKPVDREALLASLETLLGPAA